MLIRLGQQIQIAFLRRGGLRRLIDRTAHTLGQQRSCPHGRQRQHKPRQQQSARRRGGVAQRAAGQQRRKTGCAAPEQKVKHADQSHRLPGSGQGRPQRRVGPQIRRPHQHRIGGKAADLNPAKILEGVDQAPEEHHAVKFQRIIEDAAERQTDLFQPVTQHQHQHQRRRQHQREHQIIPRRTAHSGPALPQQRKGDKAQHHKPDIKEPAHNDGGQCKADPALHPPPGEYRAEHIPQMERQHKVQRIAAGHTAQHLPAQRPLIDADKLLPPQQTERMAHQHQHQCQHKIKSDHQSVTLSRFFLSFITA